MSSDEPKRHTRRARTNRALQGTLVRGVRSRVDRTTEADQDDIGDEDETPQPERFSVDGAPSSAEGARDLYLLRHPDTYVDSKLLRDAVPPPAGYCYTLDGRLVPLLEVRLPLEDPRAQQIFCEVLEVTGSFRAACDTLGIKNQRIVQNYMVQDPDFAESLEASAQRHRETLYATALQRATVGYSKPIFGGKEKDKIVGYETVVSDSLLTLLLKRHFPEFREANKPSVVNNTLNVNMPDARKMSREKREQMLLLLADEVPESDTTPPDFVDVTSTETKGN